MEQERPHRLFVRGLESFPIVKVGTQEYAGVQLAALVQVNPSDLHGESIRTPQLVAEIGRLVAAAARNKAVLEAQFRFWRDTKVLEVITDPSAAKAEGLTDGDKVAAKTTAESWVHTLPEYVQWSERIAHAEEAYATMYHTLEGAKARTRAIDDAVKNGLDGYTGPMTTVGRAPGPAAEVSEIRYDNAPIPTATTPLPPMPPPAPPPMGMPLAPLGPPGGPPPPPPFKG